MGTLQAGGMQNCAIRCTIIQNGTFESTVSRHDSGFCSTNGDRTIAVKS